ncbi:MAG: smc [Rhodospirillales bacterium]|nr:smc [Rhodospirillales bacterium]
MQFTRLRLAGFKSFVDPLDLEIAPGMTGIVGPNGCGKSNLVEALRWVMGETSARRMRGGDMDDVIFGGTATRPARNIAEVTLVALDEDGSLPTGVTRLSGPGEFEIARRIERGQGSDYRVAGRPARARDVQTLFADAASGSSSPALVSQGRVSGLINAKPTERRQVLEDAAGISGLHARRHEAELKLRAAEANLERLDDVLGTMQTQLGGLKKQARQAIRYRELTDEIRRADAVLLALRWQTLLGRANDTRRNFTASDDAVRQAMLDVAHATTLNTECAAALPPLRKDEAALAHTYSSVLARRDTLVAEERQLAAAVAENDQQARQLAADNAHEARQQGEAQAVEARLATEAETLAAQAKEHPARREAAERDLAAARTMVASLDAELAKLTESVATAEAEAVSLGRQKRDFEQRLMTLDRRIAEEKRRLQSLPADRADADAIAVAGTALTQAEKAASTARESLTAAEKTRFDAETAIGPARAAERQAAGEATRLGAEQRALAGLLKSTSSGNFPPVLDQVRVARGYETALAVALADGLEAALDAKAPVHWRPESTAESAPFSSDVEPLAPKITAPKPLSRALAHVGLVKDDATGDRLAGALAPGQMLVTRAGGLWRWDGLVRRPGAVSAAAARLEQRNRLEQVEREFAEADKLSKAAGESLTAAETALAGASSAEKQLRSTVMSATAALERARGDHVQRKRDAESRAVARQALAGSLALAETDRAAVDTQFTALQESLKSLPDSADERRRLETLRTRLSSERNKLGLCVAAVEQLGREESTRNGRLAAIAGERQEWRDRASRAAVRLEELGQRDSVIAAARARLSEEPARLAAAREKILSELEVAEKARAKASDRVVAGEAAQQASERNLRQAEATLSDMREARVRAEAAVAAVIEEMEQLKLRAVERLGDVASASIDLTMLAGLAGLTPDKLPDAGSAEARFAKLARDRESIGPVNLRAELEVAELDGEITRMTSERDDLIAAIARLRQAVHGLNKEARERLVASFGTIDAHFRRLFERLFGGGAAELKLTEAEDPLDAGLEIFASPPGKKLQQLSLLSGGEQALTAIALIFAMFLTNPSPICVLDEVDAPLDDANVDRFCLLVQEIAQDVGTRFLIITHHRLTMARMDRLYGVTMAERGISQLVSVDLRRADELTAA